MNVILIHWKHLFTNAALRHRARVRVAGENYDSPEACSA